MRVALVSTNMLKISKSVKKGTEIFVYILASNMQRYLKKHKLKVDLTLFASGDSDVPIPVESVNYLASLEDKSIGIEGHKIFELALAAKAFSMQRNFDLYHVHLSNGEWILPFARLTKKPILVTMHYGESQPYDHTYFPLFKDLKHVHFVSISNGQRKQFPPLNYIDTVYHGINTKRNFTFEPDGGKEILWAGRGIEEKGPDVVLDVVEEVKHPARLVPIIKPERIEWLIREVIQKRNRVIHDAPISLEFDLTRTELSDRYKKAKLFLNPVQLEEGFGYVLVESMACGTPVVSYARGSVPEIIKDGITGFIVNPSEDDIRGDFIIKKTGVAGLCEAVQRIYSMSEKDYKAMRRNARKHVQENFTVDIMIKNYLELYKRLA